VVNFEDFRSPSVIELLVAQEIRGNAILAATLGKEARDKRIDFLQF
jgi:hypothetical protein